MVVVSCGVPGEGGSAIPLQLGAAQTRELRLRPASQKTREQSDGAQCPLMPRQEGSAQPCIPAVDFLTGFARSMWH